MLILGRGLLPAPIWRLCSRQHLFVITEQMLAFTQTEAEELFSGFLSMMGDNAWNMEPASAMTMRVTGEDTNLSPSGGGRGDSTLPYTVSFGPAI
jgi:hypothetical protein